jgi:1-acyl-sn-glycerol-3-phosphate acyltransferase
MSFETRFLRYRCEQLMNKVWYRFLYLLVKFLFSVLMRIEVSGTENVPEGGPLILAANHLHFLDPPIIFVAIPFRRITVLAAEKWENAFLIGLLLKSVGAIFVQRGEVDRRALNGALRVLEAGGIVGLAPEGTRSPVGTMQRGKPGVAYLATKTRAQVLPLGISGQQHLGHALKRLHRPHIRARIGPLITLPPLVGKNRAKQLETLTDQIMVELASLVDPELRGVYADQVAEKEARSSSLASRPGKNPV